MFAVIIIICCAVLWLLPSIIALVRRHDNFIPIFIINIFLSFTFIGYFAALAWAFSSNSKENIGKSVKKDVKIFIASLIIALLLIVVLLFTIKKAFEFESLERKVNAIIKITEDEKEEGSITTISIKHLK